MRRWIVALSVVVVAGGAAVAWSRATRCDDRNVSVFLDPDISDARLAEVRAEMATFGSDIVAMDQEESYEEFREMFGDDPEMVDSIDPEDLPPSLRVRLGAEEARALRDRLLGGPDVESVEISPCTDDLRRRVPPPGDGQRSERSSSMVRTGSGLTGTTLSVVTPASL